MITNIRQNFEIVNDIIAESCHKANRLIESVKLIVVTKNCSPQEIIEAVDSGAVYLGENYPEETIRKIEEIGERIHPNWHMIGHIQSRKVKYLFPHFEMVHSIDSLSIAQKIDSLYGNYDTTIKSFLEVNMSGESTKFGFDCSTEKRRNDFIADFEKMFSFKKLKICGLMTMAALNNTDKQNHEHYNDCHNLLISLQEEYGSDTLCDLSMGTSSDYPCAIMEGATYIRVGEAIMGPRIYDKDKG
ncbi:MAG: YggS family pyridoxal phosphate-dependent enzyme [Chloroflexi bacterium]|nr:YggS family pyridoxal phosphate-dependent enzyme [Chloroflexota bacterium]